MVLYVLDMVLYVLDMVLYVLDMVIYCLDMDELNNPVYGLDGLDLTNRHPLSPSTLLRGGFMPSIKAAHI